MKTSVQTIDPADAAVWLGHNTTNRRIAERHVRDLAHSMSQDRWRLNGESIKFALDDDGNKILIDGQHRLQACIKAGIPFQSIIIEELDEDVFPTIDSGKRRTLADVFSILGKADCTLLASSLTIIERYYTKSMGLGGNSSVKFANEEAERLLDEYDTIENSVNFVGNLRRYLPIQPSCATAAHYIFSKIDEEAAEDFINKLARGINLGEFCPIRLFRELMIRKRSSGDQISRYYAMAGLIKTWNHVRKDKELSRFVHTITGRPEDFPRARTKAPKAPKQTRLDLDKPTILARDNPYRG